MFFGISMISSPSLLAWTVIETSENDSKGYGQRTSKHRIIGAEIARVVVDHLVHIVEYGKASGNLQFIRGAHGRKYIVHSDGLYLALSAVQSDISQLTPMWN